MSIKIKNHEIKIKSFGNAPHCIDHSFSCGTISPVGPFLFLLGGDRLLS